MRKNIVGQKYGKLEVIDYSRTHTTPSGHKKALWLCRCDCGNKVEVGTSNLKKKSGTVSCGCEKLRQIRETGLKNKKHEQSNSPEYVSWYGMKTRCYNTNTKYYKDYGGRGIKVCDEWKNNFTKFFEYIGKRPTLQHSLDRIDVNGNYEPGNVRWATKKEQVNNRR